MAAIDDLKTQNDALKQGITALGEEIAQQIQQLTDALGDNEAVAAVAADLQATNTKVQDFVAALQADDPVLPAP